MFDELSSAGAKLPIDDNEAEAVQRLGRWMRVVGTIQLAGSGMLLLLFMFTTACGMLAGGIFGIAFLFSAVIPLAAISVFLLQSLRIQAAGEQFKNLADERDIDYLELAFVRLKTVYIIDVVVGVLIGLVAVGGLL